MERMFLLAKFFEKEEYRDQFLNGKLYLNNLKYFREAEKDKSRSDRYEGSVWLEAGIEFVAKTGENGREEKITIAKEDVDEILMQALWTEYVNLLCMCKIYIPDHVKGTNVKISVPNRFSAFGEHGILINNFTEFINRVKAAFVQDGRYKTGFGHVTYSDTPPEDPNSPATIFHKREIYKCQNEYRIAVFTAPDKHDHLTIEAGSIEDIAIPFTLNRQG